MTDIRSIVSMNMQEMINQLFLHIDEWENQEIEFIQDFPKNVHELAKEIAAFASSNAGIIYLGVRKDGQILGLNDIRTKGRKNGEDFIQDRIAGICQKSVTPSIDVELQFLPIEKELVVLRIDVPIGPHPIYYSKNVPYVRVQTTSVPATPDQVMEYHKRYFRKHGLDAMDDVRKMHSYLYEKFSTKEERDNVEVNQWMQFLSELQNAARGWGVQVNQIGFDSGDEIRRYYISAESDDDFSIIKSHSREMMKMAEKYWAQIHLKIKDSDENSSVIFLAQNVDQPLNPFKM